MGDWRLDHTVGMILLISTGSPRVAETVVEMSRTIWALDWASVLVILVVVDSESAQISSNPFSIGTPPGRELIVVSLIVCDVMLVVPRAAVLTLKAFVVVVVKSASSLEKTLSSVSPSSRQHRPMYKYFADGSMLSW
jgi:hypothetical protein